MNGSFKIQRAWRAASAADRYSTKRVLAGGALAAVLCAGVSAGAQITIDSHTGAVTNGAAGPEASVDRRYRQITPTHVTLNKGELDPKAKQELIRLLQSEQGFAMRPFPRGHKGLLLEANGKLQPAGQLYMNLVVSQGLSAKPGDRVVLTDIRIEHSRIVFDLNGGPDPKHRFLRHIQIGAGGPDTPENPVVQGTENEPVGARLTLAFDGRVPEITGTEVKALLAPLISFDVKTPVQAYTDTLPPKLKDAILGHHVLVGMSTDMVLFALGQPQGKSREMEGQMPFEEWIYGKAPEPVQFVRINGNRVIRVEVAKVGEKPEIYTRDEVAGLMRTDGTSLDPELSTSRTVAEGDVERDTDTQAPPAPPSLRKPGETTASDDDPSGRRGVMKPVQFPAPKPADSTTGPVEAGQNPDGGDAAPAAPGPGTAPAPATPGPAPTKPQQLFPSSASKN